MPWKVIRQVGQTRQVNGQVQIYSGSKWVNYPRMASEILDLAMEHGWYTDDGLPDMGDRLPLVQENGLPILRILIAREVGQVANLDRITPSIQFHISWYGTPASYKIGTIYMKVGKQGWSSVKVFHRVRNLIVRNAKHVPSPYVEMSN